MIALGLWAGVLFSDPMTVVQLRYPAHRTSIVTSSSYQVFYTVAQDAPIELRRAYKLVELAERDYLLTEALQLLKAEMVAHERSLETARTAKMLAYLNGSESPHKVFTQEFESTMTTQRGFPKFNASQTLMYVDQSLLMVPPESTLKVGIGQNLANDARLERAIVAIDRLAEAHYQLRLALLEIAYPDAAKRPTVQKPGRLRSIGASPSPTRPCPHRFGPKQPPTCRPQSKWRSAPKKTPPPPRSARS